MRHHLRPFFAAFVVFAAAACSAETAEPVEPTAVVVRVKNQSIPSAFDIQFPFEWQAVNISEGVMVYGPPEVTAFRDIGPSVTLYRIRADRAAGSNEEMLDDFLSRGPLRGEFHTAGEIKVARLGQYEGLSVDLERTASEELIAMRGKILMARTDGGAVYFLSATSPTETWDENWPKMKAVLESVQFNE